MKVMSRLITGFIRQNKTQDYEATLQCVTK